MNVLLTGAASGIGRATVEQLLERGHGVVAVDIDEAGLDELPERVDTFHANVADEGRIREVVAEAEFEIVVNCAGYYELGSVEDVDSTTVEQQFRTNVFGPLNVIRHAMPQLRRKRGRIINVSSLVGRVSLPFFGVYSATKHSVEAVSDALRVEAESHGVDVVIVEPGPVATGFNERARRSLRKYLPDSAHVETYGELLDSDGMRGVDPERVARTIVTAVEARQPRNRYAVTLRARLAPKLKAITPERLWDRAAKILVDPSFPIGIR